MLQLRKLFFACTAALALAGFAHAQTGASAVAAAPAGGSPTAAELVDGQVRKIDRENRKITLKHGPLTNLDMPGMTMVFQVADEAMLDKVQPGDKVRFMAEKVDGRFTVTRMEAAR